jgi:hypothetical protein
VSRAAVANPDRRRDLREVPIPARVMRLLEPGSRAYRMGGCGIICSQQKAGWQM